MQTKVGFCGYSYHRQFFYSQHKDGFPGFLFRLQTEGVCEVVVNGKKINIGKGDLLLVKPGDRYELRIEESFGSGDYHLFCTGLWMEQWWQRSNKPTVSRIGLDENVIALWRHIIVEDRRPSSEGNRELTGYLVQSLCLLLERAVNETNRSSNRPYVVTRMMRYIEEHATSCLKVEDVADYAGLSVSRAVHLFKTHVEKTIIQYALDIRLSVAMDRMKYTSMTLEHIAEECGFGSYPYFHRVFKKKYGVAPGIYRRRSQ
jgi:AraC family transcriptional regulator, arabinose operon regulatory protein